MCFTGPGTAEQSEKSWRRGTRRGLHKAVYGAGGEAVFIAGDEAERGRFWRARAGLRRGRRKQSAGQGDLAEVFDHVGSVREDGRQISSRKGRQGLFGGAWLLRQPRDLEGPSAD